MESSKLPFAGLIQTAEEFQRSETGVECGGGGAKQYSKTFDDLSDPRSLCPCMAGQPLLNPTKDSWSLFVPRKKHKKQLLQTCLGSPTS